MKIRDNSCEITFVYVYKSLHESIIDFGNF